MLVKYLYVKEVHNFKAIFYDLWPFHNFQVQDYIFIYLFMIFIYFNVLEFSLKSGDKGARTACFGIIGHQTRNWE